MGCGEKGENGDVVLLVYPFTRRCPREEIPRHPLPTSWCGMGLLLCPPHPPALLHTASALDSGMSPTGMFGQSTGSHACQNTSSSSWEGRWSWGWRQDKSQTVNSLVGHSKECDPLSSNGSHSRGSDITRWIVSSAVHRKWWKDNK